jgi:Threonyl and Alanyl tRNA synthetase second additional domain
VAWEPQLAPDGRGDQTAPLGAIRAWLFQAGGRYCISLKMHYPAGWDVAWIGRLSYSAVHGCPRLSTAAQRAKVAMMMVHAAKLAISYWYNYHQRGTHIRNTAGIGPVTIGKIENKGRQNRRINIAFAE